MTYCSIRQSQSEYQIRQLDDADDGETRQIKASRPKSRNEQPKWLNISKDRLRRRWPAAKLFSWRFLSESHSAKGRAGHKNMRRKSLHRNEKNENYSNVVCVMRTQFIKISSEIIVMSI